MSRATVLIAGERVDLRKFDDGWLLPPFAAAAHFFRWRDGQLHTACGVTVRYWFADADGPLGWRPGSFPLCQCCESSLIDEGVGALPFPTKRNEAMEKVQTAAPDSSARIPFLLRALAALLDGALTAAIWTLIAWGASALLGVGHATTLTTGLFITVARASWERTRELRRRG